MDARDPAESRVTASRRNDAGSTAVLVIHGFTADPRSIAPWAQACEEAGYTVSTPLLPGHGTTWQDLATTDADAWTRCVEEAYDELAAEFSHVAVCGLSMGGALAAHLASVRRPLITFLANPALAPYPATSRFAGALKHVVPTVEAISGDIALEGAVEHAYERVPLAAVGQLVRLERQVRGELPGVAGPVVLFRSDVDHVVSDASVKALKSGLRPGVLIRHVRLERSMHVATLDHDADLMAHITLEELGRLAPAPTARRGTGRHRGDADPQPSNPTQAEEGKA